MERNRQKSVPIGSRVRVVTVQQVSSAGSQERCARWQDSSNVIYNIVRSLQQKDAVLCNHRPFVANQLPAKRAPMDRCLRPNVLNK